MLTPEIGGVKRACSGLLFAKRIGDSKAFLWILQFEASRWNNGKLECHMGFWEKSFTAKADLIKFSGARPKFSEILDFNVGRRKNLI